MSPPDSVVRLYVGTRVRSLPRLLGEWLDVHPANIDSEVALAKKCGRLAFSTHNPYIVDAFKASEVWCVAIDKAGPRWVAFAAPLSAHPDWATSVGALSTGEFWSILDESWVLDSPAREKVR